MYKSLDDHAPQRNSEKSIHRLQEIFILLKIKVLKVLESGLQTCFHVVVNTCVKISFWGTLKLQYKFYHD